MSKFGSSQSVTRVEDQRFLTGAGRYTDDIAPENALHAFVLRSPVAHATFTLDTEDARQAPGVHAVITAEDLATAGLENKMRAHVIKNRDGERGDASPRTILAEGRVRFVGDAVAFIVAETLAQAKDAAELIELDFDDLPVKLDLAPGGPVIHETAPDNIVYDFHLGDEAATDAALAQANRTVTLTTYDNRIIVNSMEPRSAFAETEGDKLHVAVTGQGVWGTKNDLIKWFGLSDTQVRVTNPDIGGGFGMKAMEYPEYRLVALAARQTGHPVRWIGERTESMLSDNAGRDLNVTCTLGFDANNKITAYKVDSLSNMGAYNSEFAQAIQSNLFARVLCGPYDIQTMYFRNRGIFTNTTQVDAYRGAGRPEAIYALERVMDFAARELGVDPLDLRRTNFIADEAFPYKTATDELYDVGEFNRVLTRAATEGDVAGFAARRATSEANGKYRGLGVAYYIESILGDPSETAKIELHDGGARLYVGTQSNGQGHETVYRQILHDQTGLPFDQIEVVQGDSDLIAKGGGTGGSRSVTTQGVAMRKTADVLISNLTAFLDKNMDTTDMTFDAEEGVFRAPGSNVVVTLLEAAEKAHQAGEGHLATSEETTKLPGRSFPNGCHIAEVEIDADTGETRVDRYTVVDDLGVLMNPMLAEGQVHGGVVQGIGQAITEQVVYDEDGQLLTATFMDYGMPRADDVPYVAFYTEEIPSTANPLGMKGCGEAGTVGALGAVANAVQDALWPLGLRQVDMPFTPSRVWHMLQEAKGQVAAE
ncbi:xanthine dehydrogenase family protein molybdopterin-binding subunit [Gymnodinialimonas hymeniacidonis]|uniref:xanthine dehydrogenase family protein molybdopterin-binding subunit n=1 Tax=Gymnodinialimonas hymeniacidonis TaxID=3126508 RepID=UPI0034C68E48